ncbi:MAG TPA: single-stranded-DNA-specific exonuclease RecJ [Candidatus Binatia bacterium]|jgi:single-stranded-DNA-specific exonuclease|nr:single-stranded-DNA-specific exonuclease RecJ [Candidatus Binatia bacterium]
MQSRWRVAPELSDEVRLRFPEAHPVALRLLANRGIATSQEAIDEFVQPDYEDLHDPFMFRDMERACERVWRAIENGEKVVIHGDYDADGITGSTVLMTTFRDAAKRLGKDPGLFASYLPHREKDGYGVRPETVERLAAEGATLMITVDCGISCRAEIALAAEKGMDTIVVDHHQIPEKIPECIILHPLVDGETYPFKKLAAVGVSFKFACGFIAHCAKKGSPFEPGYEKWLMDLVSIATVTDVMPLVGENRTLERYGLIVLNKTRRIGLRKLIEGAGLEYGSMDTMSVGFSIGPRINAASRMEHAELAFKCLMAETEEDAVLYAERLNQANRDRQKYTEQIMAAARAMMAEMGDRKIYCLCGDGWSAGIVGLVAGKLVSEVGRPVFVFGKEGERIVGSGRSIPGFNVVATMERAKAYLARFGGHPQACGLTIEGDANYAAFCREADAYAEEMLAGADLRPALDIDAELRMSQVSWELVEWMEKLEPFGEGNPRPKFLLPDLAVSAVDVIGKNRNTVRIAARGDLPKEAKLIGFNFVQKAEGICPGMRVDAVVELGVNAWNGRKEIQLKLVDVRPAASAESTASTAAAARGNSSKV